ncbi:hypothetical protein F4604DRAFT_1691312 [Suillus subluteus]|nr:hypothetical protein F4604DRAFT_1691312 [Suillus subluteus]
MTPHNSHDIRGMQGGLLMDEMAAAMEGDINTCHVMVYLRNLFQQLLISLKMSQDSCALNANGSLKDTSEIKFYNDPDERCPIATGTRKHVVPSSPSDLDEPGDEPIPQLDNDEANEAQSESGDTTQTVSKCERTADVHTIFTCASDVGLQPVQLKNTIKSQAMTMVETIKNCLAHIDNAMSMMFDSWNDHWQTFVFHHWAIGNNSCLTTEEPG